MKGAQRTLCERLLKLKTGMGECSSIKYRNRTAARDSFLITGLFGLNEGRG